MTEAEHYFSEQPSAAARHRRIEFTVEGEHFPLTTASGVFSGDRLDPGTAVLLDKAPLPSGPGEYLDLGCGYGPITMVLATFTSGTVHAVDVNTRALDLVRRNAADLGVSDRVHACEPTDVDNSVRFDQIWSNPPIRVGKQALHELLSTWLPRLAPGGIAWLVVARHKGADSLTDWLTAQGFPTEKHASQKGYRVLRTTRA